MSIFTKAIDEGAMLRRGIKNESFDDSLTRIREQNVTDLNEDHIKCYTMDLMSNKFQNDYFSNKDGDIFYLVRDFFQAEFGTPKGEIAIKDLIDFCSQRWYYITTPDYNEKDLDTKMKCKWFHEAFNKGTNVGKENPLKEGAWIAVHAFITGLFLDNRKIYKLIPRVNTKVITHWNNYIASMSDIPDEVKKLFTFDANNKCKFCEIVAEDFFAKKEHPSDDEPVIEVISLEEPSEYNMTKEDIVQDKPFKPQEPEKKKPKKEGLISTICKQIEKKVNPSSQSTTKDLVVVENTAEESAKKEASEMDQQYKNAIAKEDAPKPKKENDDGRKSFTPKVEKTTDKTSVVFTPAKDSLSFGQVVNNIAGNVTAPTAANKVCNDMYEQSKNVVHIAGVGFEDVEENNKLWHSYIPRLEKLTKQLTHTGYQCVYTMHHKYAGMLKAYILYNKQVINVLAIDPCVVYGDTIRIMVNTSKDIRQTCFIPMSQEDVVSKAVNDILIMSDVNKIMKKIPNELFAIDNSGYTLLDRIDFSGLSMDGRDGLPFDKWRELVKNLYNVTSGINVRFRIDNFESPKKFDLVCDGKVVWAFDTKIINEPSHKKALEDKLVKHVNIK